MDLRYLLLVAHLGLIFTGVVVAWGPLIPVWIAFGSGHLGLVRATSSIALRLGNVFPIFYMSGGLFGLLTAIAFGKDLLAPWLVIAYVLFAIATVSGIRWTGPHLAEIAKLASEAPDGPIPTPLAMLFTSSAAKALWAFDVALVFVIVFDMVVKPFS
ncbi:MAG TPA: hypothetical protein VF484_06860 [Candidatus Limnocylindrales bacterium]